MLRSSFLPFVVSFGRAGDSGGNHAGQVGRQPTDRRVCSCKPGEMADSVGAKSPTSPGLSTYLRFLCGVTICVLALLQGCGLPKPKRQATRDLELPQTWTNAASDNQGRVAFGWLEDFEDQQLERLVAEAIDRNRDLRVAAARLQAARESTIIAGAARLPQITASWSGSYSESRTEDETGDL